MYKNNKQQIPLTLKKKKQNKNTEKTYVSTVICNFPSKRY